MCDKVLIRIVIRYLLFEKQTFNGSLKIIGMVYKGYLFLIFGIPTYKLNFTFIFQKKSRNSGLGQTKFISKSGNYSFIKVH